MLRPFQVEEGRIYLATLIPSVPDTANLLSLTFVSSLADYFDHLSIKLLISPLPKVVPRVRRGRWPAARRQDQKSCPKKIR